MSKSDLINDPYVKYIHSRTAELIDQLAKRLTSRDELSYLKFIASLCQELSIDEAQILQNQAVLDDRSLDDHENTRDRLLSLFSRTYIKNELLNHGKNKTLAKFQHKDGGIK